MRVDCDGFSVLRSAAGVGFWASVTLLAWVHAAFPAVVLLRAWLRARPVRTAAITPSVSVIIAAHNEADQIRRRLENLRGQAYPVDAIEIIVASDGSTDDTVGVIEAYAGSDPRVRTVALSRVGKIAALDAAVRASSGEILVFTDANTLFASDAIARLVAPFADPAVGGVAGDQRYLHDGEGAGERGFWSVDRVIKQAESAAGSTISATGAIYAVRRALYDRVPPGVTDDFAISTGVVAAGRRLVFAPDAVAWERVADTGGREYARKVRIITQGLQGVRLRAALLDPRRSGFYAVQLLTHKLLRRLGVVPLLVVAASTPFLAGRGSLYRLALAGQMAVYGLGVVGLAARGRAARIPLLNIPAFFCLVNAAALHALWNTLRGRRIERWNTDRTAEPT